jgi:hypothetical protein
LIDFATAPVTDLSSTSSSFDHAQGEKDYNMDVISEINFISKSSDYH